MLRELAENFRPVAPPRLIDNAYSEDQHQRLGVRQQPVIQIYAKIH